MIFKPGRKLVMIGDSITDYERKRPVGEGLGEAMGHSYVVLIDALLKSTYPDSRIRIVNMGNSGDTVRDLKKRWRNDVLDLNPDWVSVLIGVNDVWRQFDSPLRTEEHVYYEEFEETYEQIIQFTEKETEGIILMTPFYMEPNPQEPMRKMIDKYGEAVKKLAKKHNCILVDVQTAFDEYLRYYSAQSITWDRIHPDVVGHTIIARSFLNAVGFEWKRS
ncbi:MAG: SGNH/GDSL hydrolase family protein [Treponema sp.]|jgi:lysophospholipase L1-like esterase|nr:SGNH/GDSL hydrolase family protein [Treponema sp.]